jgi:hypothetical protein
MAEQSTPSKAQLIETLRSSGAETAARLRSLPAETFEQGRYENGWNGRQILAHVASIEWTYPRLFDLAREASAPRPAAPAGATTSRGMQGGINDYNERQVEKRAGATVAELIDEFETNRAATIAAAEAAGEALFGTTIRSAGGITGPLASVLTAIAVLHVTQHVNDIAAE